MTTTPKTIPIFLPGGDPHGIRIAETTTRIVQVIEVPRNLSPGRTSNDWREWKAKDGRTLDEVKRQAPEGDG